jgi:hypothetical protein
MKIKYDKLRIIYKLHIRTLNGAYIEGMFHPTEKTIYISKNISKWKQLIVLIHEIGHYIMHLLGFRDKGAFVYDAYSVMIEPIYIHKIRVVRWLYRYYCGKKQ